MDQTGTECRRSGARFACAILLLALVFALARPALAQVTILDDDFEAEVFSADWDATTATDIVVFADGALGTDTFASLQPNNGGPFGALLDGATTATIDFYTRLRDTELRAFNLHLSDIPNASPTHAQANVNIIQAMSGGVRTWFAYSGQGGAGGVFQPIPGLTGMTSEAWYHVQVTARDWGTANARYDIQLSDAGGTEFTESAAGLTFYQHQAGFSDSPTERVLTHFNFNTRAGIPGFDIDEVHVTAVMPSAALAGDYNGDGFVNAADYTVWRNNFGGTTLLNETVSIGMVDQEDYNEWKSHFGAGGGSGATIALAVPEPNCYVLVIAALAGCGVIRRRLQR